MENVINLIEEDEEMLIFGDETGDYEILTNKPAIDGKELSSKSTSEGLGLAKKTDIPTVPTNVSEFKNDAGYLAEHQDISDLKAHIKDNNIHVTEIEKQSWNDKQPKGDYALNEDIPDVSNFITKNVKGLINYTDTETLNKEFAKKIEIPNTDNFITKEVNDLTNYTDTTTLNGLLDKKANASDIPDVSKLASIEYVNSLITGTLEASY